MGSRAVFAAAMLLLAGTARAATLHFPADFETLQAAVDAADPGDTVRIAPGEYRVEPDANGIAVWLAPGVSIEGYGATLDASLAPLVLFGTNVPDVRVEGLTIRDCAQTPIQVGRADGFVLRDVTVQGSAFGGVSLINSADVLVERSRFIGNRGEAVVLLSGRRTSGVVRDNFVSGNPTRAIYVNVGARAEVVGNHVVGNRVGIRVRAGAVAEVHDNFLAGNDVGLQLAAHDLLGPATAFTSDNRILTSRTVNVLVQGSTLASSGDVIAAGDGDGVVLEGEGASASFRGSDVLANGGFGLVARGLVTLDLGTGSDWGGNALFGNALGPLANLSEGQVQAVGNWWGGPRAGGIGASIEGDARFEPFLAKPPR